MPQVDPRYESPEGAQAYARKYRRSWLGRFAGRRELAVVRRALQRAEAGGRLLDLACGAGRLTPTLLRFATKVTCVDASPAMIEQARAALRAPAQDGRVDFAVATADDLPFAEDTFDTGVCHRLLHHVRDEGARRAILAELARVSRRRVVCSFGDADTRAGRDSRRAHLTTEILRADAEAVGLELLGVPLRVSRRFSIQAVCVLRVKPRRYAGDDET